MATGCCSVRSSRGLASSTTWHAALLSRAPERRFTPYRALAAALAVRVLRLTRSAQLA